MPKKSRDKEPDQPAEAAFSQQASSTHGSNFQAGRDIHFHENPKKPIQRARWLGTTQSVLKSISLLIGIAVTLSIIIPRYFRPKAPTILVTGVIKAKESETGISDAYITSDLNFRDTIRTTSDGTFQFQVQGAAGQAIRVYVWANHFKPRNEIHTLGSSIEIHLAPQ
jgi:hypothetical protein